MTGEVKMSANEMAQIRTELAAKRTIMAADRTLMAWLRTSLSLISFGFTIYKVLQGVESAGGLLTKTHTPQSIGLFLTGMGTIAMIMGTFEYWMSIKELHQFNVRFKRSSILMALGMAVIGLLTFISIITRLS